MTKNPRSLVKRYLRATGWTPAELSTRAGIDESSLSHLFALRRPLGPSVALAIELATKNAHPTTGVEPLLAIEISKSLAERARSAARSAARAASRVVVAA